MAANNRIYIQVDVNSQGAVQGINILNRAIAGVGTTAQQSSRGVSSLAMSLQQSQSQLARVVSLWALWSGGKQVVKAAADIDQLKKSLEVVEGSALAAKIQFGLMIEMSKLPGLSIEPLMHAFTQLRQLHVSERDTKDMLREIGNAMALMGKGGEELGAVMEQVVQSLGKGGRIMQEDLRFITQRIPQVREAMQKLWGTGSTEELAKRNPNLNAAEFWKKVIPELSKLPRAITGIQKELDLMSDAWKRNAAVVGEAVGGLVLPKLRELLDLMGKVTKWFQDLPPAVKQTSMEAATFALEIGAIVFAVTKLGGAVSGLWALLLAHPELWPILGLAAVGFAATKTVEAMGMSTKDTLAKARAIERNPDVAMGTEGNLSPRLLFSPKAPGLPANYDALSKTMSPAQAEAASRAAEARAKYLRSVLKQTTDSYADALVDQEKQNRKALEGQANDAKRLAQEELIVMDEMARHRKKLAAEMLEHGVKPTPEIEANQQMEQAARVGIARLKWAQDIAEREKKAIAEYGATWEEEVRRVAGVRRDVLLEQIATQKEMALRTENEQLRIAQSGIESRRDLQMEALDQVETRTLQQQLAVTDKRLEIEEKYVRQALGMEQMLLDLDQQRVLAELKRQQIMVAGVKGLEEPSYLAAKDAIEETYDMQRMTNFETARQKLEMARVKNVSDKSKMVRTEMQHTFDYFQRLAEGVFDALATKSKSVWQSMADFFKMTMLTMVKSMFTSLIANSMMALLFGAPGAAAGPRSQARTGGALGGFGGGWGGGGGGGGLLGGLGPLGGLLGGGGGGWGGWGGGTFPGGTGAGSGSGSGAGTGSQAGGRGGLLGFGSLLGLGTLGGGALFNSGSIAMSGYSTTAAGIGGLGGGLAGFASSPLGIGAGLMLATAGVKRGGILGGLMTTGGGALAGFGAGALYGSVGGPLGMAIGAAIGGTIGLIRGLMKTATEKTHDRVKQIYGIDITSKQIIQQITDIVKTQFGGDMNVGLYSPQVQEIVRLYQMTQGVAQSGMGRPMLPVTWSLSQGSASLQPVYSGGYAMTNPYTGLTTTQIAAAHSPTPAVYVQLDPAQANQLFEGRVVNVMENNGPAVADAATGAMDPTYRRFNQRNTLMEPLTLMS